MACHTLFAEARMENIDYARIFDEIADVLELKGENVFRIRSYRRGAQVIRDLPEDIHALIEEGELTTVPGIGSSLALKIEEIARTGTCEAYEDIKRDPDYPLLELTRITGIGPKLAVRLNRELGIVTVDELERAAGEARLRGMDRVGEKLEEKILRGIDQYRRHVGRFKLSEAMTYARTVVGTLKKVKGVSRIDIAGSLRRMKETIGDIDILVISKSSDRIMDAFTEMETVADILAKGDTKSSVVLKPGIQVDLRILPRESYGAALHYFTGSKEHNVVIRDRAKRAGLKVSEYGVFDSKDDHQVAGATEKDVYRSLGLPLIPPELRENRGEIEAAERGRLPELLDLKDIKGDLQMHSTASDGKNTISEMARHARDLGYSYIAITDHSKAVRVAGGLDEDELLEHIKKVRAANRRTEGIHVMAGVEVDILADGSLDLEDRVLEECDVVVAAVHSGFNMKRREMTGRVIKAMANPNVNILAHPTGRLINEREPFEIEMEEVIKAAGEHGVALEINGQPDRLDLRDIHCHAAKLAGVKVSTNTDAHAAVQLGFMQYAVATARRGWIEPEDNINTYGLRKLRAFLKK
jgi:DNA polymerase (family 10)